MSGGADNCLPYFSIFFEKVNKPCVNFLRVWTKDYLLEILRKFSKLMKNCHEKIVKNALF